MTVQQSAVGATPHDAARRLASIVAEQGRHGLRRDAPWYLVIGPSGAGKTTALKNSGLEFAPQEVVSELTIESADFDWRIGEGAVLIRVSGKFAFGPEHERAWKDFLAALLRLHKPFPINGVIVMMSLDDLIASGKEENSPLGRRLRGRLRDIDAALRLAVPVYCMVTKFDRLAGFSAFFDDLTAAERLQVWGVTLPFSGSAKQDIQIQEALAALTDRLNEKLLTRLRGEADSNRRNQFYAFPRQWALVARVLQRFLAELVAGPTPELSPWLRGIYFSSAQRGGPLVDLAGSAIAGKLGVDLPRANSAQDKAGGFFLKRLFEDVIFQEQNLVSVGPANAPDRSLTRRLVGAASGVAIAAVAAFLLYSYIRQDGLLDRAQARIAAYIEPAKAIPAQDVATADIDKVVPILDRARTVAADFSPDARVELLAFDQSARMQNSQGDLYRRALNLAFLPRLLVGLQQTMQSGRRTPNELDDDAKLYLMLAAKAPVDATFALTSLTSLFERLFPGADRLPLRRSLADHTAAMLAMPLMPASVDPIVIEDASARLAAKTAR